MIFTVVIVLIVVLVVMAIGVNAIQQHKQKQEAEKRQELAKYKAIIEETEEVLMNSANIPVSKLFTALMHKRILNALRNMQQVAPENNELKTRIKDAENRANSADPNDKSRPEDNMALPDNERQIIAMIQGIKKMRTLLRSEHSKGSIETQMFMTEDKRLEKLQLKINLESLWKRGQAARSSNMLGSARQYFEKALAVITQSNIRDEGLNQRKNEIETVLSEITSELKNTNAADRAKKQEQETDELDVLFQPKKKW